MDKRFLVGILTLLTLAGWGLGQTPNKLWWTPVQLQPVEPQSPYHLLQFPSVASDTRAKNLPDATKAGGEETSPAPKPGESSPGVSSPDACKTGCGVDLPTCCQCICGPPGRLWVQADALVWWMKGSPLPPLVTTSPVGTPRNQAGVLGAPGTTIVIGDSSTNHDERFGGRFTVGYWLNDCQTCGIEANYFLLEERGVTCALSSQGTPILARPFFNVVTGMQDAQLIAFPGLIAGSVKVCSGIDQFTGAEALGLMNLCCGCCYRVDLLAGYRFLRLEETLSISEDLTATDPQGLVPVGTRFQLLDQFNTKNEFHGGEIGGVAEFRHCDWSLDLLAKFAIGNNHQTVTIDGSTTITVPGQAPNTFVGGLLAQRTNIGHFTRDEFSFVPEFGITLGYQFTQHLRATLGYTLIYWTDVVRPGNQIDLALNPTQIPPGTLNGSARPAFNFNNSDFWAQGINFGLEFRY